MDHRELKRIKLRRGFVESPTGGFVRSADWLAPRLAKMAQARDEWAIRVAELEQRLGPVAGDFSTPEAETKTITILPWLQRIKLAAVISGRLIRYGNIEAIRDLIHG